MKVLRTLVPLGAVLLVAGQLLAADDAGPGTNAAGTNEPASAVLVTLDYTGGLRARRGTDVSLEVFADGRVHFGNPFGTTQPLDTKLTAEQLAALLEFILVEQEFRRFDIEELKRELATATANNPGRVTRLMDASTMVLKVRDGELEREATVHSLETMAVAYPEVPWLRQLLTIQRRLEQLRAEAYAGGPEEIARHLAKANAQLARDYPDAAPLKPEHLEQAWQSLGGRRVVKFLRSEPLPGNRALITKAEIDYPIYGEAVVSTRVSTLTLP